MAEVQKHGSPEVLSVLMLGSNRINGAPAGEPIEAGDACHIDAEGAVRRSTGAAAGAPAEVHGFAAADARQGEATTLVFDVAMRYGRDLPLGASLYVSGTAPGGLADTPSPGGRQQVAYVVDGDVIHVLQSYGGAAAPEHPDLARGARGPAVAFVPPKPAAGGGPTWRR